MSEKNLPKIELNRSQNSYIQYLKANNGAMQNKKLNALHNWLDDIPTAEQIMSASEPTTQEETKPEGEKTE